MLKAIPVKVHNGDWPVFETGEVHSMNFNEDVSSFARAWEW